MAQSVHVVRELEARVAGVVTHQLLEGLVVSGRDQVIINHTTSHIDLRKESGRDVVGRDADTVAEEVDALARREQDHFLTRRIDGLFPILGALVGFVLDERLDTIAHALINFDKGGCVGVDDVEQLVNVRHSLVLAVDRVGIQHHVHNGFSTHPGNAVTVIHNRCDEILAAFRQGLVQKRWATKSDAGRLNELLIVQL